MNKTKILFFFLLFIQFNNYCLENNIVKFLESELKKEREYFLVFKDYNIPNIKINSNSDVIKVFFRGEHYANAINVDENSRNFIVFNKDYTRLMKWPYFLKSKKESSYKPVVNIPSFLYEKINSKRYDKPLFLNAYQTQYGDIVEGFSIAELKEKFKEDVFLIEGSDFYPKDQLESKKQIKYLNNINNTERFNYLGDPLSPSYKCYFFAIANIIDFYNLKKGKDLKDLEYVNFLNGKKENGTDPRFLELCYRFFSKKEYDFKVLSKFFFKDPITSESVTYSLNAASEIPLRYNDIPDVLKDEQVTKKKYLKKHYRYLSSFRNKKDISFYNFEQIKNIIRSGDVLLGGIGMNFYGAELKACTHAVMICGFFQFKSLKLLVYKDNYGIDKMFKMLPLNKFKEIYLYKTGVEGYENER